MKAIASFTFILFLVTCSIRAQSPDSAKVAISQEDCRLTLEEMQRFVCYITRANVAEKTLFKLGFWPNTGDRQNMLRPQFRLGFNAETTVERKIHPAWSILAGLDYSLQYSLLSRLTVPFDRYGDGRLTDEDRIFQASIYAKIGARYYYAMARRIRQGKSANNFSGNYLGLQVAKALSVRQISHLYDTGTGQSVGTQNSNNAYSYEAPLLGLMWGMQRRLGSRGYFDVNVGPELTLPQRYESFIQFKNNSNRFGAALRVNASIGLGW